MPQIPRLAPTLKSALLVLPWCLPAYAADGPPPPDGQWRGHAGAALSVSGGNTRSQSLQVETELSRRTVADRVELGATLRHARGEEDGVSTTTAQQLAAFGQYDWNLGPRWYAFGRLEAERDGIVDLDLRSTASGGLGWKWIETPTLQLRLSGGLGVTDERYATVQTIGGTTDDHFRRTSLRLAVDAEQQLGEALSLNHRLEWQPSIAGDDSDRSRYRADASVAINRTLGLSVGLRIDHLSRPPAGRQSTDTSLFTGLNWRIGP